jgi:large repetitive protein
MNSNRFKRTAVVVVPVLSLILGTCAVPDDEYVIPEPPFGIGFVEAGDANLLYIGRILTPAGITVGEMLVDAGGTILYIGTDSSGFPEAAGATRLVCAHGIAVPGLIDAWRHANYAGNSPVDTGGGRYDHRHQWRLGLAGHPQISIPSTGQPRYDEAEMILSGTTSFGGPFTGTCAGMVRNLRLPADAEGLFAADEQAEFDSFPLDDSAGTLTTDPTSYPGYPDDPDGLACSVFAAVVAEGIIPEARCEFLAVTGSGATGVDILTSKTAIVHGIALMPQDLQRMAAAGATLVWTPRSDLYLYGNTAPVTVADRLGCTIALGSTWTSTGSPNLLEELRTARFFNRYYLAGYFSDSQLLEMATLNAARAYHVDDRVGTLEVGKLADFAVFDTRINKDYQAVFAAGLEDVAIVFRGGRALCGDTYLIDAIRGSTAGSETLNVNGTEKRIFAEEQFGVPLSDVTGAGFFPLVYSSTDFLAGVVPSRPAEYSGLRTSEDRDGDGVPDASDNAASIFNPPRPVDGGVQGDQDDDGIGDVVDDTPLP